MRSKVFALGVAVTLGFLLVTNPVVTNAAATLTGKDIENGSLTGRDVKDGSLKGKDVKDGSVSGTDLADGTVAGSDLKDGSVTGTDVSDGTLTGADIKDLSLSGAENLVRVATATADEGASTGVIDERPVLTTSITAPVRGYLVIDAGSDLWNTNDDADVVDCWIAVDETPVDASIRVIQLEDANGNGEEDCSTNVTVPVLAGAHQVQLVGYTNDEDTQFDESSLSVLFVPFGPTGVAPSPRQVAQANAGHDAGTRGNR